MRLYLLCFLLGTFSAVFACKCSEVPTVKTSFENADVVFVGEVYDVIEVPSGYDRYQNVISKVNVSRLFKSSNDAIYRKNATIFGSPFNSCHVLFDEKGTFLIFANYENETGLLYSDQCFVLKNIQEVTQDQFLELEKLKAAHEK